MDTNETALQLAVAELLKYVLMHKEDIYAMLNNIPLKNSCSGHPSHIHTNMVLIENLSEPEPKYI